MPLHEIIADATRILSEGGFYIWPIVVVSLVMWILISVKIIDLLGLGIKVPKDFRGGVLPAKKLKRALWKNRLAHRFQRRMTGTPHLDIKVIEGLISRETAYLDRYITTILALAYVAPLMGLLGTVGGMTDAFDVISVVGTGSPRGIASGISKALVTTQGGLLVSLPGIMAGHMIQSTCRSRKEKLRVFCESLYKENLKKYACNGVQAKPVSKL